MAEQLNNVLFYDKTSAKYKLPDTSDTFRLNMDSTIGGNFTTTGSTTLSGILSLTGAATMSSNLTVDGNLVVKGTTETVHSETVLIQDNYLDLNHGYSSDAAQQGGLTVNYDPTTTKTTSASFTAGAGSTAPKVTVASSSGFAVDDIIQIDAATDVGNDGLYLIKSISSNDLTVYGVAGTAVPAAHTWAKNQFTTNGSDTAATVCKVAISIMKVDSSGDWQVGKGSNIGSLSYAAIQTGTDGTPTLDEVYEQGNEIGTNSTSGNVLISGDQKLEVTATGGVKISGGVLDVDSTADFDVTSFDVQVSGSGMSLDAAGNSNFSTSSGTLAVSAPGALSVTSSGAALTLTGAAASTWSTSSGALTIDSAGVLTMDTDGTDAINLGTEAAAKTITIGADASTMVDINALDIQLDAGSGGYDIDGAGNSTITTSGSGTLTIDSAGALVIDTDGTDSIDIGTESAAKTITIGADASTKVDLNALAIELDSAGTIVGNSVGATTLDAGASSRFQTSSGDIDISAAADLDLDGATVNIDSAAALNATGTVSTLNGSTALVLKNGSANMQIASGALTDGSMSSYAFNPSGAFNVTSGANSTVNVTGTLGLVGTTVDVDATTLALTATTGGFGLDANGGASRVQTTSADLNLNTVTSGDVKFDSAGNIELKADGYIYNKSFISCNGDNPHLNNNAGIGVRMVAGENISSGHMTYIGNGGLFKADASSADTAFVLGVAKTAISSGSWGNIRSVQGTFCRPLFTTGQGPTQVSDVGSRVYLSETAGEVTLTAPTASGAVQFQVGSLVYYDSSNPNSHSQIVIQPQYLAEVP